MENKGLEEIEELVKQRALNACVNQYIESLKENVFKDIFDFCNRLYNSFGISIKSAPFLN